MPTPIADTSTTVVTEPDLVFVLDVVGSSREDAEGLIVAAGLVVGSITDQPSNTIPEGNVISQSPSTSSEVPLGTSVDLVISSSPQAEQRGDLNGDGCVDRTDFDILMADVRGPEPHNPVHDLNNDGIVNRADARTLVGLFTNPRGAPCN